MACTRSRTLKLVRFMADKQIPIEVCITSNVKTGCCLALEEHPVRKLFDAGVPIVLNTDDPDMFHTDLISEYRIVRDVFHFNEPELRELAKNSFRASFLPEGRKKNPGRHLILVGSPTSFRRDSHCPHLRQGMVRSRRYPAGFNAKRPAVVRLQWIGQEIITHQRLARVDHALQRRSRSTHDRSARIAEGEPAIAPVIGWSPAFVTCPSRLNAPPGGASASCIAEL